MSDNLGVVLMFAVMFFAVLGLPGLIYLRYTRLRNHNQQLEREYQLKKRQINNELLASVAAAKQAGLELGAIALFLPDDLRQKFLDTQPPRSLPPE